MTEPQPLSHPPRHVAFDWGGVFTVGTFDGRSTQRLAERLSLPVEAVRASYFRHVQQLELGHWPLERFWAQLQAELGTGFAYPDFEALYLGSVHDNAPMYGLLSRLPRGLRVGLLSNNYPVVADHLRARPEFARFGALVFSNELGAKKPEARAFAALEQAMGVPAAQIAFVDDVAENIEAARACGFHGLLYHHDQHADFEARLSAWLGLASLTPEAAG